MAPSLDLGYGMTTYPEKEKTITEAATKNQLLFFEHDPFTEMCSLKLTERGIKENESMKLEAL